MSENPHCLSCGEPSPDLLGSGLCPTCLLSPAETSPQSPAGISPGDLLNDRYRLVKEIGHGGMGSVFEARQLEPVSRKVAVKIIKPGMDSLEVLKRFEAERQILALLDHPNIASILDGGITENGRPYFVMDLAEGPSLSQYLLENDLSLSDKITLFQKICQAVIHAHQRGIIHRDLKPSNILMTGEQPLVIDFGIAKSLNLRVSEETLLTQINQQLGTPASMAPEQFGTARAVDIRTDIYGLGALLYEILTGQPPFDPARLAAASPAALEKIIFEENPPRPGSRLPKAALPKDLDWITMRALEKDPARRYQTVNDLVSDLQSFRDDETITARPPSTTYQLGKFAKRHRLLLATTTLIILSLLAATLISLNQARKATAARDDMETVKNASENLLTEVVKKLYPEAQKSGNFKPLISSAKGIVNYLDQVPPSEDETIKNLDRKAAGYRLAAEMLETSGDFPGALDASEKYLKLRAQIFALDSKDPWVRLRHGQALNGVGWCHLKLHNPAKAAPYFEKAATIHLPNSLESKPDVQWISNLNRAHRNHALALSQLGDLPGTIEAATKCYETSKQFAHHFPDNPDTPRIRATGLSILLSFLVETDLDAALEKAKEAQILSIESAQRLGEDLQTSGSYGETSAELSDIHHRLANYPEALEESQKSAQVWQHHLDLEEKNANMRLLLANRLFQSAAILTHLKRPQEARETALTARDHFLKLLDENPNHPPAAQGLEYTEELLKQSTPPD